MRSLEIKAAQEVAKDSWRLELRRNCEMSNAAAVFFVLAKLIEYGLGSNQHTYCL